MAKLRDFAITNWDGGLVTNRSDLEMDRNMLKNSLNYDVDEFGRLKRRLGIQQWGDTKTGSFDDSFIFTPHNAGSTSTTQHLIIDNAANATLYKIVGNYTTLAITTSSTTIDVGDTTDFAASGTVEINGDLIAYSGKGAIQLTGVTGIVRNHAAFSAVNQIQSVGTTGVDTRSGAYFAVLNNVLFINGRAGSATYDGTTITVVADTNEAAGLFATDYRDRIYVAGSGRIDASGNRNGNPVRVSFTDEGDSTDWGDYTVNFFDVEDDMGQPITGLRVGEDILFIFKYSSIWTYDETNLKQRVWGVGAWNNRVVQKINDLIYTFCPTGVYITNGYQARKISEPVDKYLRNFRPQFDGTVSRVVVNTFAGIYHDKYYLFIGNINEPETLTAAVLVYDTIRKNWTVHDNYMSTNPASVTFGAFGSFNQYNGGTPSGGSAGNSSTQWGEALFVTSGQNAQYFRLFDNRFRDREAAAYTQRGGDVIGNLISDNTGSAISTVAESPFLELGSVEWKKIGGIMAIVEKGDFQISYRLQKGELTTDWVSLGDFHAGVTERQLKQKMGNNKGYDEGYRIAFKVTSNTADVQCILNALIVREIETIEKKIYAERRVVQ